MPLGIYHPSPLHQALPASSQVEVSPGAGHGMLAWDLSFQVMNCVFSLDTISSSTWVWNTSSTTERDRMRSVN